MTTFIIATNNKHKLLELKRILNPLGINAISAGEAGVSLDEVEETGTSFAENAYLKANAAFKLTGMPSIADDSGLSIDALNGAPGVFSARYAGDNATDIDRIDKVLSEMKDIKDEDRGAHFTSSICCILKNGKKITVEGYCNGKIGYEPSGENGFGYDPIFICENGKTFAQLTKEEKDEISHRGNALRKLKFELINCKEEF